MGTCFGHCFKSRRYNRCQTLYFSEKDLVEFDCLVEKREALQKRITVELIDDSWSNCLRDEPIVQDCMSPHLPLHGLESFLSRSCDDSKEFVPLDPKELLASRPNGKFNISQDHVTCHSTPPSSIDLEWEHEDPLYASHSHEEGNDIIVYSTRPSSITGCQQAINHLPKVQIYTRQSSITNDSSSASKDNSRITTPDSLEWDFVDTSVLHDIDRETEQLIAEIEYLAARALEETGEHLLNNVENTSVNEIT